MIYTTIHPHEAKVELVNLTVEGKDVHAVLIKDIGSEIAFYSKSLIHAETLVVALNLIMAE